MFRFFVSLVLCACACACAGPASGSGQHSLESGTPGRVTLIDYRTSNRLTLVNEAHTDPSKLYTEKRETASIKVTSNEDFEAMLAYFDDEGFSDSSMSGSAPITGDEGLRKALEVETSDGIRHMLLDLRNPKAHYETLQACTIAFVQLYNLTDQNQAITNENGKALFEDQQRALNARNKKQKLGLGLQ